MGIINCKECGNLCVETSAKLCAKCQQDYFDAEITVAEYLRSHENSTLDEVHIATKVAKHIILKMIQEGRVIEGKVAYSCERCGVAISTGRYCKTCEEEVLESLTPPAEPKEESAGKGMYITKYLK